MGDDPTVGKEKSDACRDKVKDIHNVIFSPNANYSVNIGPISDSGRHSYSDTPSKASFTSKK